MDLLVSALSYALALSCYVRRLTLAGPMVSAVRVPGGRAAEAIKPLAVMQAALNSGTILVIHHTGQKQLSLASHAKGC